MLQILFAILAGFFTIGAPCILPVLPIILAASVGRRSSTRPVFIVLGFIVSFTLAALLLSAFTKALGIPPDLLRNIAIALLLLFGILLAWKGLYEKFITRLSGFISAASKLSANQGEGNKGGFIVGLILGVVWTPCAGPVLGAILTLIAAQANFIQGGILLIAYALGAGLPMLVIAYGGQAVTTRLPALAKQAGLLQQIFGSLVVLLAILMFFQYDTFLINKLVDIFPAWNFANSSLFNNLPK